MSIIPGIETAAPERTETSNGSSSEPNRLPVRSSSRRTCSSTSSGSPSGRSRSLHVRAAGVGRDREALRDGNAHLRHLREPDPLAAEQLTPPGRRLVEAVDVAIRPSARESTPAAAARTELGHPGDRPQAEPERREEAVEEDERGAERGVPRGPAPLRDRLLGSHAVAVAAASARRRSTSWMIRCEISSIESSLTSSTGQPSRRCICSAYSSSS